MIPVAHASAKVGQAPGLRRPLRPPALENFDVPATLGDRAKASTPTYRGHRPTAVCHLPAQRQSSRTSPLFGLECNLRASVRHDGPAARPSPVRSHFSKTTGRCSTGFGCDRLRSQNWPLRDARMGDHAQSRPSSPDSFPERLEASRLAQSRCRETSQLTARSDRPVLLARREL